MQRWAVPPEHEDVYQDPTLPKFRSANILETEYWNPDSDQALGLTAADNNSPPRLLAQTRDSFVTRHLVSGPLVGFRSSFFPRESPDELNAGVDNETHGRALGSRHSEQLMPGNFPNNGPEIRGFFANPAPGGSGSGLDDSDDSDDLRSLENNIPSSSNGSNERRPSNLWSLSNSVQGSEAEMPDLHSGAYTRFVLNERFLLFSFLSSY